MDRDCAAARPLLSLRLDGVPLDAADAEGLEAHLAACAACRVFARDLAAEARSLAALWSPIAAPIGFTERTVAALPPRAQPRSPRRRPLLAAALALALLSGALLGSGEVRAGVDLLLRRVGLREESPPTMTLTAPLRDVTLAEARGLVPWSVRLPMPPPDGYLLDRVAVGEVYGFAAGPAIFLFYTRDGAVLPQLVITQFRAADKGAIVAPIAAGAGRRVPVGATSGLFVEGMWVDRGGQQVWERGTLVRLIIEDGTHVVQFEADPGAGWDEAALVALAERLR